MTIELLQDFDIIKDSFKNYNTFVDSATVYQRNIIKTLLGYLRFQLTAFPATLCVLRKDEDKDYIELNILKTVPVVAKSVTIDIKNMNNWEEEVINYFEQLLTTNYVVMYMLHEPKNNITTPISADIANTEEIKSYLYGEGSIVARFGIVPLSEK